MKKGTAVVISSILGVVAGGTTIGGILSKAAEQKNKKIDKFKSYYNLLNQWLILKQEGKSLENYFVEKGYQTIAIYGMGEMGNRLYDELKGTSITVKYAIDKSAASTYSDLEVREIEDELAEVDAIIVTAIFAFDEIEQELKEIVDYPVISLEDVAYEV